MTKQDLKIAWALAIAGIVALGLIVWGFMNASTVVVKDNTPDSVQTPVDAPSAPTEPVHLKD